MEHQTNQQGIPLSEARLREILATDEGRHLLALLQKTDASALREAARAAKSGDYAAVQRILAPYLQAHGGTQFQER